MWKSMQAASPALPTVVMVQAAPPSKPGPSVAAPPDTTPAPVATPSLPPIAFKIIPDGAFLVVGGEALAPTVRSLARPSPGASEKVIVRADGFEDQTLTIDDTAPASVDVWLNQKQKKPSGHAGHGDDGTGTGSGKAQEALPANPY